MCDTQRLLTALTNDPSSAQAEAVRELSNHFEELSHPYPYGSDKDYRAEIFAELYHRATQLAHRLEQGYPLTDLEQETFADLRDYLLRLAYINEHSTCSESGVLDDGSFLESSHLIEAAAYGSALRWSA